MVRDVNPKRFWEVLNQEFTMALGMSNVQHVSL